MNQKNFVNFHILISHSPSCLNRDDMNMQKTAVFGGVRRVRISSQSLKRAMRFSPYYFEHLGRPSIRTRSLEKVTEELLKALRDDFDEEVIRLAAEKFVRSSKKQDEREAEDNDSEGGEAKEKGLAVAPWITEEIRVICEAITKAKREGLTEEERQKALKKVGKTTGKGKDKKTLTEQDCLNQAMDDKIVRFVEDRMDAIKKAVSSAKDIALSGRMATSGLMTSVDGALAVAHVITTHTVDGDIDWFTAVDDLVADAGEVGAGHLNTQEFSAGVFYRYASLNIRQLQENLGGASRERVLEIAKHVLHLLATVVPSAKQQTFAAHNPADFALVSFADQPISLANAFEAPIKNGRNSGFLQPSMERLAEYWETINSKYGLGEQAAAFSLREIDLPRALKPCATLPDLETWIETGGHA
jgi:CRISPR system Cascade subunit CasC